MSATALVPLRQMAEEIARLAEFTNLDPNNDFKKKGQAHIRFESGRASLSCVNNADRGSWRFETELPAEIDGEPFSVAVCARRLALMLEAEQGQLRVTAGEGLVTFKHGDRSSFSLSNNREGGIEKQLSSVGEYIEVIPDRLRTALARAADICGENVDQTPTTLDHVLLESDNHTLSIIGADSCRMSIEEAPLNRSHKVKRAIPKTCATAISKALEDSQGDLVQIGVTHAGVVVTSGKWQVHVFSLAHEKAPDWRDLVDNKSPLGSDGIKVSLSQLRPAMKLVDQFTAGSSYRYAIFSVVDNKLLVKAQVSFQHPGRCEILEYRLTDCENDLDELAFRVDYLRQAIKGVQSDTVTLYFGGSGRPIVLEADSYHHLLMPVSI